MDRERAIRLSTAGNHGQVVVDPNVPRRDPLVKTDRVSLVQSKATRPAAVDGSGPLCQRSPYAVLLPARVPAQRAAPYEVPAAGVVRILAEDHELATRDTRVICPTNGSAQARALSEDP